MSQYLTRKWVKFLAIALFITGLAFLLYTVALSLMTSSARSELRGDYYGQEAYIVSKDSLSHQSTRPFIFAGKTVTPQNEGAWKQFEKVILRFPDASSCLNSEGQYSGDLLNLLDISWDPRWSVSRGLVKHRVLQVCIFRILTTLDDKDLITGWFEFHDFELFPKVASEHRTEEKQQLDALDDDEPASRTTLTALWSEEQYYERFPSWIRSLIGVSSVGSFGYSVEFFEDGTVSTVTFQSSSHFN